MEILQVELKVDSVQAFNANWHETVIARKSKPDDEILKNLYVRQWEKSAQLKQLLLVCIQDTF